MESCSYEFKSAVRCQKRAENLHETDIDVRFGTCKLLIFGAGGRVSAVHLSCMGGQKRVLYGCWWCVALGYFETNFEGDGGGLRVILGFWGGPKGYVEWHEWAEKMSKTHKQKKCPCCGLYKIWVKKEKKGKNDED